jgi:hypothetical protein
MEKFIGITAGENEHALSNQDIIDKVRLDGLIRLIAEPSLGCLVFNSPNWKKMSGDDWSKKYTTECEEWERTKIGHYPPHYYSSCTLAGKPLTTLDGKSPRILQAYSPIRFELPVAKNENYHELMERIEEESMRMVNHMRREDKTAINSFYMGNLRLDWVLCVFRSCPVIPTHRTIFDERIGDFFVPRYTYDFCLFKIDEDVIK